MCVHTEACCAPAANALPQVWAAMCLLRATVSERQEDVAGVRDWLLAALQRDSYCVQAVEMLVERHLLTPAEQAQLLRSLPLHAEDEWLAAYYDALLGQVWRRLLLALRGAGRADSSGMQHQVDSGSTQFARLEAPEWGLTNSGDVVRA